MRISIMCLDDNLPTVYERFSALFSAMLEGGRIPTLMGGVAPLFLVSWFGHSLEVEITSNSQNSPEKVIAEVEARSRDLFYDLVLIDDNWGQFGTAAGQQLLLPSIIDIIRGSCQELPVFVLFTQHWDQSERVDMFCGLLARFPGRQHKITAIHKDDTAALMLLFQRIVIEKKIAADRAVFQRKFDEERELAHSPLGLLEHVRGIVGVGDLLMELASALEPYFLWKDGRYDNLPDCLREPFPSAILFEGEPGSGKTTLCRAICTALDSDSDAMLPKDLGPSEAQGRWRENLTLWIRTYYLQAQTKRVVVIRADDLVWPPPTGIVDVGLRADWIAYLNTLRECVEDAALINNGQPPIGSITRGIRGSFQGKILWLFARNRDEEVGPMFEPLQQKLMAFRVEFPRDIRDRRDILRFHAEKNEIKFEEDTLAAVVADTLTYSGRDLIGDDTAQKGFLWFAIRKVRQRERAKFESGIKKLSMVITDDVFSDWLASREREEIERRIAVAAGDHRRLEDGHPDGSVKDRFPAEDLRSKARQYLDRYENACLDISGRGRITQRAIAGRLGVTDKAIIGICKEYGEVMLAFLDEFPGVWPTLATRTQIRSWCSRGL